MQPHKHRQDFLWTSGNWHASEKRVNAASAVWGFVVLAVTGLAAPLGGRLSANSEKYSGIRREKRVVCDQTLMSAAS